MVYKNNAILLCGEDTKIISLSVSKAINGGTIIVLKYVVCDNKKSRFIKKEKAKGLLSNLSIRTLLSKIPILRLNIIECNFIV